MSTPSIKEKVLYSTKEAANYLGVSQSTVRKLAQDYHLDQRFIGNKMVVTAESLEVFVEGLPRLPDADFWTA